MFFGVFIDDDNKDMFLDDIEPSILDSMDLWVGLVKEETDTACGVLGAESVTDKRGKLALSIRYVKVAEDYNDQDVVRELLRFLCDIAADIKCSTVSLPKIRNTPSMGLKYRISQSRILKVIPDP